MATVFKTIKEGECVVVLDQRELLAILHALDPPTTWIEVQLRPRLMQLYDEEYGDSHDAKCPPKQPQNQADS